MNTTPLGLQLKMWRKQLENLPAGFDGDKDREMITKQIGALERQMQHGLDSLEDEDFYPGSATKRDDDRGLLLARIAKAQGIAFVKQCSVREAAHALYGAQLGGLVAKSADLVLSSEVTTAPGVGDFVNLLRKDSLYDKLMFRQISPYVPVAVQTVAATAAFVGEGQTATASKWETTTLTLAPNKVVSLIPATIESIRDNSIAADRNLTQDMLGAISNTVDSIMFGTADATAHAPRGLLYGISPIVSAGTDADDLQGDVKGLLGQIDPLLVQNTQLLMHPLLAFHIGQIRTALGGAVFPTIGINGGSLEGVPVVVSTALAYGTIVAIVASEIYSIGDQGVEIAVSNSATVAGTSAYENALLVYRAIRPVSWAFRRQNVISYLTGASYGETASPTAS